MGAHNMGAQNTTARRTRTNGGRMGRRPQAEARSVRSEAVEQAIAAGRAQIVLRTAARLMGRIP
jgi:hypothetical protein